VRANTISGSFVTTGTSGAATPANFTLTNNPDVAASITATSGTSQSTRVNTNFANQLQVLVRDQFGNLVPNSIVTFTSPSTGASTATTTTSATTDANGVAQVSVRANTISGSFVTTGTSGEATPANFTLTNTPDVPASNTSFTLTNNPDVPVSTTATSGTALSNVVNQAFKGANNSVGSQATKTLKDGAESVDSQATKTLKDEAEEEKNLQFE
jgi:cell pole-organizing protein PopZ